VDTVFQAFTGLMSVNRGLDGIPHRVPVIVMDMATALSNFQAMAVALYARRDEPRGRYIESSLLRGGATIQAVSMIQHQRAASPSRVSPRRAPSRRATAGST
jgi:crotonobetainyl-CoA:carnitine CoA-transferase CaiB-like acyl-CoA transferase